MNSEGALKDAAHASEAAQRFRKQRQQEINNHVEKEHDMSQMTMDFRMKPECQSWYHHFLGQVTSAQ